MFPTNSRMKTSSKRSRQLKRSKVLFLLQVYHHVANTQSLDLPKPAGFLAAIAILSFRRVLTNLIKGQCEAPVLAGVEKLIHGGKLVHSEHTHFDLLQVYNRIR